MVRSLADRTFQLRFADFGKVPRGHRVQHAGGARARAQTRQDGPLAEGKHVARPLFVATSLGRVRRRGERPLAAERSC